MQKQSEAALLHVRVDGVVRYHFRHRRFPSLLDGVHSKNSLHYTGNAFDLRVWIYTEKQRKTLLIQLRKKLGIDYDVVDEVDHLHIEYDPL